MDGDRTIGPLAPAALAALDRARRMPLSYGVRAYACPNASRRLLVVLGEAHLKLGAASRLGKEILGHFDLRGVEGFQKRHVFAGRVLGVLITGPRIALRILSFGLVKGSTITDAHALTTGTTFELEKSKATPLALHIASLYLAAFFFLTFMLLGLTVLANVSPAFGGGSLAAATGWLGLVAIAFEAHLLLLVPAFLVRKHAWSWIVHPAIGIVTTRDRLMVEGTVRMLDEHPHEAAAIVVMGRAHLPGFERELVEKHRFERIAL